MPSILNGAIIHEPEVCDVMVRFLRPGQVAVDVGANDGYFTGFMSYLVGENGLVVAFEPDKALFEQLEKNSSDLSNVTLSKFALWSDNLPMEFHRTPDSGYSSMIKYENFNAESYMVLARSLDTLLLEPQPNFIKVDCEGSDEHILRGAQKILRNGVDCVIAEVNFYINYKLGSTDKTLRAYMQWLGYDCFLLEKDRKPLYLRPEDKIKVTGVGVSVVNAMFAKRSRVEELWQYDCRSRQLVCGTLC
jgi:FkbM family methyltransferase